MAQAYNGIDLKIRVLVANFTGGFAVRRVIPSVSFLHILELQNDNTVAGGAPETGKPAAPLPDEPDPKAQRNFTDPDSRIMKSKEGFVQAYNAQAAVDAEAQIIVAHELTPNLKALVARGIDGCRTSTRPAPDSGKRKSWWTADAT